MDYTLKNDRFITTENQQGFIFKLAGEYVEVWQEGDKFDAPADVIYAPEISNKSELNVFANSEYKFDM